MRLKNAENLLSLLLDPADTQVKQGGTWLGPNLRLSSVMFTVLTTWTNGGDLTSISNCEHFLLVASY